MYGITDPLSFLIGTILVVLLPGPNSMFVLTVASLRGVSSGYRAALGVFAGDSILMAMAAMGAASVLYANPVLFMALKYAGAGYLAYVGVGLLRRAWQHWRAVHPIAVPAHLQETDTRALTVGQSSRHASSRVRHPLRRALLVSLINPKAIFFFLSFFVQFVDTSYAYPVVTFFALGMIVQVCSFVYLSILIFTGVRLAHLVRNHRKISALSSAAVGALFLVFGVRLADATVKAL